jgi:hypothetical protein
LLVHDFAERPGATWYDLGYPTTWQWRSVGHKTRSVFERYDIVSESDLDDAAKKIEKQCSIRIKLL